MMTEAIDKADWELLDKGLPIRKKPKVIIPPPKMPKVENQIVFADIPLDRFEKLISARRRTILNEDGIRFIGMDIKIEVKKRAGRPLKSENPESQSKTIEGWMAEGDWHILYRHIREKIDFKVIVY
jgi:hypothetical protein